MWKNDKPEDAVDKYEDEETVSRPNGTERAEVEKIMVKKPQRGEAVRNVSFNKCGDKLVSAGYDCCLKLLDTETDDVVSRFSSWTQPYPQNLHRPGVRPSSGRGQQDNLRRRKPEHRDAPAIFWLARLGVGHFGRHKVHRRSNDAHDTRSYTSPNGKWFVYKSYMFSGYACSPDMSNLVSSDGDGKTGSIRRTQILEFLLQLAEAGNFHSYLTLDVVYKIELEVHKKPIASSVFRSTWLRGLRELRYRFWVSVDSV
ncbi:splicing factor hPRP17 [Culex quinquefasciatus]|uniref:Splicing factor hPRP17 n=1 Tax=Culex quinquefasciatus TaxID=7176 RepID=B0W583_CULQU|nr:splicing factor hPRP17 [Culex quinquefasciatus]|eukprot:XP_001843867.1 splicing factor hPRP17 [Culex quinquefasciatus]